MMSVSNETWASYSNSLKLRAGEARHKLRRQVDHDFRPKGYKIILKQQVADISYLLLNLISANILLC